MAGEAGEVRFSTSEPATKANDPSKPAEGTVTDGGHTVHIKPPEPKAETKETKETRPAWLPEKFKSAEDLVKAYAEAEKALATKATPAKSTKKESESTDEIGFDAIDRDFATKGEVSEKTLAALEAKGFPRKMAVDYVEGQKARADAQLGEVASIVGGTDALKAIQAWAGKNVSAEEIAGYNAMVDSGNLPAAKLILKDFHQRYTEAVGKDPSLVNAGSGNSAAGVGGYASTAEMVRDMQDRRYQTDPAFRKHVEKRVGKSNF